MILFPNAKINLGLRILNKREDGFHNIESCLYPIPIYDILEILPSSKTNFEFTGSDLSISEKDNLCFKAWEKLSKRHKLKGIHLHLHKIIPHGAGLGGGSSDAAFTLKAIDELYDLRINNELIEISSRLGSDCPFFVRNQVQIAKGKGDLLSDFKLDLSDYFGLIVKPDFSISTAEAYSLVKPKSTGDSIEKLLKQNPENWKAELMNDFEIYLEERYPELKRIREMLYQQGAIYASMSGSGSAYFGIFKTNPELISLNFPDKYFVRSFAFN